MTEQPLFTRRRIESVLDESHPEEEYYALVVRGYPRRIGAMDNPENPFDVYDQSLSPTWDLLKTYNDDDSLSWHQAFEDQVGRDFVLDRSQELRADAASRTVVFCCYEPDDEDCHTYTILDILADEYGADRVDTRDSLGGPSLTG